MLRTLLVAVVLASCVACQCGLPAGEDGGAGGGAPVGGGAATGGGGGSVVGGPDGGYALRLQVSTQGSSPATNCNQLMVRGVGAVTVAPVEHDTVVGLDGGRWVQFFESATCTGTPVDSTTLAAGTSTTQLYVKTLAFGALAVEASAAGLDSGVATFTSIASVGWDRANAVVATACTPLPTLRTVFPGSSREVPAASRVRLTLIAPGAFGGSATDAGCFNNQWDVFVEEGASAVEAWGASTGSAGMAGNLRLSPVLPPSLTLGQMDLALFAQCLGAGAACDGGAACCAGACATGACP